MDKSLSFAFEKWFLIVIWLAWRPHSKKIWQLGEISDAKQFL